MHAFTYAALPARVIFGSGALSKLGDEIRGLGCRRALILSTPHNEKQAQALALRLGDLAVGVFAGAVMHTPVEATMRALSVVRTLRADCTLALGGGSTTGLGKAIALRTDLPQIAIPTTYAGSEATPILGETENGVKTTQKSAKILPEVVVYDVDLTLSLPVGLSGASGLNAIAHAVEALYAKDRNPVISLLAEEGVRALAQALPAISLDPHDREARSDALYGAWLCGSCLGAVGMALHHKLCHALGGAFNLPHAQTHAIVLPHALAYNAKAAPDAGQRLARALGCEDVAQCLFDLSGRLGLPRALKEIGMPEDGIAKAADLAMKNPYWNPRPLERGAIGALIRRAYEGGPPA